MNDQAGSLFDAVKHDDELLVRRLLDAGVNPNDLHADGQTPLMVAARKGNVSILQLLLDRGALPDSRALILAAFENHPRAVSAGHLPDKQRAVRQLLIPARDNKSK